MNTVSVMVPTYNHEQYIGKALSSVLEQSSSAKIEIHVFDDHSTDRTAEIVAGYVEKYPDIVKLYQTPKNLGSGLASFSYHKVPIKTEFWCILEGDDYWISDTCLQKKMDILSSNSKIVGCAGNCDVLKEGQENKLITTHFQNFNLADCSYFQRVHGFYLHTSSFLWRNIFPRNIPPFPDGFYDIKGDPALAQMMMGSKFSIYRLNETVSAYRITGQGRWTRLSKKEQQKRNTRNVKKIQSCWPFRHRLLHLMVASDASTAFTKNLANRLIKLGVLPKPINIGGKI